MALCPICSAPSDGKRINFNGYDIYDLCIKCASYSVCLISPNVDIPVKENAIRWAEREIQNNAEKMYLANCIRSWKSCAEDYISAHTPEPIIAPPVQKASETDRSEIDLDATIMSFNTGNYSAVMYEESKTSIDSSMLDIGKTDFFHKDEPEILAQPVAVPSEEPAPAPAPFSVPYEEPAEYTPSPDAEDNTSEAIEEFAAEAFRKVFDEEAPSEEENTPDTEEESEEEKIEELFGKPLFDGLTDEELEAEARAFVEEVSKNFTEDEPDVKDYLREISVTLKSINERMEKIEKEIAELKK